jgi:hydroxypyruvate isomerase
MTQEFRYSYNVIGFQGENIAESIDRLARLEYDAVEVEGEPDTYDPKRIKKLAQDAGLAVGSVCPNFTAERDLSHPDPEIRNAALAYLREVSGFAAALGAPLFIVAPTAYSRVQPVADPHDEWKWAVEGIRLTGEHAGSLGVDLTLECWNRYGTYMLNRLDEGARMWRETGLTNGGIMADTFHMNVEERSISGRGVWGRAGVRADPSPPQHTGGQAGADHLGRCGRTGYRPYVRSRAAASAQPAGDAPGLTRCERDRSQGVRGRSGLRTTPSDRTGRSCPGS